MKPEIHLIIVWEKAGEQLESILLRAAERFKIKKVYKVFWSEGRFSENLTRFYGQNLPAGSDKEIHIGTGPFHAIVFEDAKPQYERRKTTKGLANVNINCFDLKQDFRDLTGGGHKIHGTNSPRESARDLWLLFGKDTEEFSGDPEWDGTIRAWDRDLVGAGGWPSVKALFATLNRLLPYVVLRNFEPLPDAYHMESHGDIDLLVGDLAECVYLTNAVKAFPEEHRVHYYVSLNGQLVPFDFRYSGDNYYDRQLENDLLETRVFTRDCFYAPTPSLYFYTLLYHALIHKPSFSEDYASRLRDLAAQSGLSYDGTVETGLKFLARYFYRRGYDAVRPIDVSVFFHEKNAKSILPSEAAELRELEPILEKISDLSVLSHQMRLCFQGREVYEQLSSLKANLLRPLRGLLKGKVLEIGAGCGTITRFLGEQGLDVTAMEESVARAAIAKIRTRDLKNVSIISDSFCSFQTEARFDCVLLIGALERAHLYADGENPVKSLLERARDLLKPDGKIILAADNQLGLKYFAGNPEELCGRSMYGIEDRYNLRLGRSFGRKALAELLQETGFGGADWLFPFPSYQRPISILTQAGLDAASFDAGAFAWQTAQKDRPFPSGELFSPELAWPVVFQNGLASELANAFLVVASCEKNPATFSPVEDSYAYHYSTNRLLQFCKETQFCKDEDGAVVVRYELLAPALQTSAASSDNGLSFVVPKTAPYVLGHVLSWDFIKLVSGDAWTLADVSAFLRRYIKIVAQIAADYGRSVDVRDPQASVPGALFDLLPQNIIVNSSGKGEAIDLEWGLRADIELAYLVFRALISLGGSFARVGNHSRHSFYSEKEFVVAVLRIIDFPYDELIIQNWIKREAALQAEVTGFPAEQFVSWGLRPVASAIESRNIPALLNEYRKTKLLLEQTILQANTLADENRAIRNSRSWRLLAPVRFIGHVLNGDKQRAGRLLRHVGERFYVRCPERGKVWIRRIVSLLRATSSQNNPALQAIVRVRHEKTRGCLTIDPLTADVATLPCLDISAVTYNSLKWIEGFAESLRRSAYPKDKLNLFFVDNGSTDGTVAELERVAAELRSDGLAVSVIRQSNKGYGAGHDVAIRAGCSPFCLVTNVDLVFDPNALRRVASTASIDDPFVAAWELRQKPYEHPKAYDPVTGLTNWNAHACVLLRRSAYEAVGGYDRNIFMYGEDVELSYKLRAAGHLLKYCPEAVVHHYSYDDIHKVKPLQYAGSTFANLYLRLKYGRALDRLAVPILMLRLLLARSPYAGAKRDVLKNYLRLARLAPKALLTRPFAGVFFPFRGWDYEMIREGGAYRAKEIPEPSPRVTVITRTIKGRNVLLRQSMLSVLHQTYPDIELIVVEDGGESMREVVENVAQATGRAIRYLSPGKVGRSGAGNAGLDAATGQWCLFLDDDDLLFADHVETLVGAMAERPDAAAAYSLSWMVPTDFDGHEAGAYAEQSHQVLPQMHQPFDRRVLREYNYMAIQSVLFQRSLYASRGGFDEDMDALEDWILWNKYACGNDFVFVPKVTSLYRTPVSQVVQDRRQEAFNRALPIARARIKLFNEAF